MNIDFRFYFSLFVRRIHYFLICLALGSAIGITLATVLPPVYEAEARLLVESEVIDGGIETNVVEQLQIIENRVLTRASILELVNDLDVYRPADGGPAPQLPADDIVEDMRERIRIVTTDGTSRRGTTQATIVDIRFAAANGRMAAAVANQVVDLMLAENTAIRTGLSQDTLAFYRTRVEDLERELSEQNQRILAFQQDNPDSLPDSLAFRRSRQLSEQERLQALQRDETRLRDLRETLVRVYEETGQLPGTTSEASMTAEERQLQQLQSQRATLVITLAETHPRVRQIDGQIATVQEVVNAQRAATGQVDPSGGQLSEYDLRLAEIDGQLDFIANQQLAIQTELEELRITIEATPGNAITLETMQRDLGNIREQYDRFIALLAEAETGALIEITNRGQRISIIENAVAPREPTSPNRPILAAAGIGGGFMLGLAFIVLLELLNSSIRRPVDLTNKLGIAPLGAIPNIRTRWEILRRRSIIFAVFAVVLIVLPLVLWFIHTSITPLDVLLNGLLNRFGLPLIS